MPLLIEPYAPHHLPDLQKIMSDLVPQYFAEEELPELAPYLAQYGDTYFVAVDRDSGAVLGGGGHVVLADGLGRLSWFLVSAKAQGTGAGSALVRHNLAILRASPVLTQFDVRTSQYAHSFFAKFGFRLTHTAKDYWAKGIDLYHMVWMGEEI